MSAEVAALAAELASGVQIERLWADLVALADFQDEGAAPYTRRAFRPAYEEGRQWLDATMAAAGLRTSRDAAGSLVGTRGGGQDLAPLVLGSHTDTVEAGGRFDGALGVLAAVEIARVLAESDHGLAHPLEVVDFTAEEPNAYGSSCIGSRAWAGVLDGALLDQTDADGEPLARALPRAGADLDALDSARREPGSLAAYVELHIEQGPLLERGGKDVGVVNGIVGIRRYAASLTGRASHAGTTPIDQRSDALATAAALVLAVEREAREADGALIGTVGRMLVEPNAPNVVPGRVELAFELRSLDDERIELALERIAADATSAGAERGVAVSIATRSQLAPVLADEHVVSALEAGARHVGASAASIPSLGGHDASQIAAIAPVGMLFAPSRDGISHHADEWTSPEQCAMATRALLGGLVALDASLGR